MNKKIVSIIAVLLVAIIVATFTYMKLSQPTDMYEYEQKIGSYIKTYDSILKLDDGKDIDSSMETYKRIKRMTYDLKQEIERLRPPAFYENDHKLLIETMAADLFATDTLLAILEDVLIKGNKLAVDAEVKFHLANDKHKQKYDEFKVTGLYKMSADGR